MTCEKCGIEYEGEICNACTSNAPSEKVELPKKKTSGLGIAGMILGIVSLAMFVFSGLQKIALIFYMPFLTIPGYVIGMVPGIVGLVLCSKAKKANSKDTVATIGKILSLISIILKILGIVIAIIASVIALVFMFLGFGATVITSFFPSITY
ncbi:MAG: hypothetical protein J6Q67_00175 [Clostridia bacterium]|nr:hypothetical protein [Clostridia bacterium]